MMHINFPLVLVIAVAVSGFLALLDRIVLAPRRRRAIATYEAQVDVADPQTIARLDKEPLLVEYGKSFFPVLAVVLILRSFLVEPFQIPSGSMLPTLEVGDFILVNKYAYGLRLPVAGTKVVEIGDPERGDVMVFRYPEDGSTNYIKRVIGLPGDHIRYRNKQLFINNEPVARDFVARLPPMERWREQLGPVEHDVYLTMGRVSGTGEGEWVVPEGHYFVMGDNRDNSNDSRYWGTVPDELVVGKAFAIWMHWKSLTSLPSFDRVGGIE